MSERKNLKPRSLRPKGPKSGLKPFDQRDYKGTILVKQRVRDVGQLYESSRLGNRLILRYNPFFLHKITRSYEVVKQQHKDGSFYSDQSSELLSIVTRNRTGLKGIPSNIVDDAIIECYGEMYEKVANVADLIRTTVENKNMVVNALVDLTKAYKECRKGNVTRALRALGAPVDKMPDWHRQRYPKFKSKIPSDRFLEISYGWLPTLGDIHEILSQGFGKEIKFEAKGKAKFRVQEMISIEKDTLGPNNQYINGEVYLSQRSTVKVRAKFGIKSHLSGALSAWGIDNPLALAWEALPYSFVVDWFFNVGSYLNDVGNISQPVQLKEMVVIKNTYHAVSGQGTISWSKTGNWTTSHNSAFFSETQQVKERDTTIRSRPLPHFKNPFTSMRRFANQFALFSSEVHRRT